MSVVNGDLVSKNISTSNIDDADHMPSDRPEDAETSEVSEKDKFGDDKRWPGHEMRQPKIYIGDGVIGEEK